MTDPVALSTFLLVFVTFIGLLIGIRTYRRQTNAQVFLEYTKRYENIMESFPTNALPARLALEGTPPPQSTELSLALLRYLNLSSEEFYLQSKGYLAKEIWLIWEGELTRTLRSPLMRREWKELRSEFDSYPEFLTYVDSTLE